jgi:tetratricopeptide (TPR) repeat protein
MVGMLRRFQKESYSPHNPFTPKARLSYLDSLLALPNNLSGEIRYNNYIKAITLLEMGSEKESIKILERLSKDEDQQGTLRVKKDLAMAYLREGERSNCIHNHASASCILPIQGLGIYKKRSGSEHAIEIYQDLLRNDPADLESRWLLNIAYMTLGEYPDGVPPDLLIPDIESDSGYPINAFEDIAGDLKIDHKSMSGGSIAEDFNNDGYLDIIVSSWASGDKMQYFMNNGDGTFRNSTAGSGLGSITGGLNMIQADYDNDGLIDILVLRGAWKRQFGKEPNSLLRNNGDDTFTDVTIQSGLLSFHPTQTATWSDFNNDGWLDLFIGNETNPEDKTNHHPCELFLSNQDGTFTDIAAKAKCDVVGFVKGVTSGDYNNDGWQDIFISALDGRRRLLKNNGSTGGQVVFQDVTTQAQLDKDTASTFTSWFWDYNNDGWLDILTVDYSFERSLAYYAATEKLSNAGSKSGRILLYRNNQNKTFTNVATEVGLDKVIFSMGGNFGDIDNDGFLDIYLGTGNPRYQSLIPNKMFKNVAGEKFADVTSAARVGHLQKGHGVSFADMDNDGDQDIHIQMGGAYPGDSFHNSLFLNPGQNTNNWIGLSLEGKEANRSAIGTRLTITLDENGIKRRIYRDINSGGSFGASPLRSEIGLGRAERIESLEIRWAGSNQTQVIRDISANQFVRISEGSDVVIPLNLKKLTWVLPDRICY